MGRLRSLLLLRGRTAWRSASVAGHLSGLLLRSGSLGLLRSTRSGGLTSFRRCRGPRLTSGRGPGRRRVYGLSMIDCCCLPGLDRATGGRSLLRDRSGSGLAVLSGGCHLRGIGSRADPAGSTVKAGPVISVADVLAVSVMNDRRIYAAHRSVIGKVPALPAAAVKTVSAIAEAIIDSAIEAHGRPPIACIKGVKAIRKAPVTGRPEETFLRRGQPGAGYPVIARVAITPVSGRPNISVGRAKRLLINFQSRRRYSNR